MKSYHPYTIFPLGDSALTIEFGNLINEEISEKVLRLFHFLQKRSIPYITDLVPAYSSLTIYYDTELTWQLRTDGKTSFDMVAEMVERLDVPEDESLLPSRLLEIPVCYAAPYAPDLAFIAREKGLSIQEIINIHTSTTYRVYMIGFLPGFAYMGENNERIAIQRKSSPVPVKAGSVGLAGLQTGIYPLDSPGGWQIIGRTPVKLFDGDAEKPALFEPGDKIKFHSITEHEFEHY